MKKRQSSGLKRAIVEISASVHNIICLHLVFLFILLVVVQVSTCYACIAFSSDFGLSIVHSLTVFRIKFTWVS